MANFSRFIIAALFVIVEFKLLYAVPDEVDPVVGIEFDDDILNGTNITNPCNGTDDQYDDVSGFRLPCLDDDIFEFDDDNGTDTNNNNESAYNTTEIDDDLTNDDLTPDDLGPDDEYNPFDDHVDDNIRRSNRESSIVSSNHVDGNEKYTALLWIIAGLAAVIFGLLCYLCTNWAKSYNVKRNKAYLTSEMNEYKYGSAELSKV